MIETRVTVRGIRELGGAFRAVDADIPKHLRVQFLEIAKHVVGLVQQRVPFLKGEAAASVRPRASQRGASIAFPSGGTPWRGVRADYYPWLDFGGRVGRKHAIHREVVKGGRFVYPAIGDSKVLIGELALQAMAGAAREAGFDTKADA